jgi:tetratricopeptide (TPR) repeat protein
MVGIMQKSVLLLLCMAVSLPLTACGGPANLAYTRGRYFEQRGNGHLRLEDPISVEGKQEYQNAIEQYSTALKLQSRYLDAVNHRATCYLRIGNDSQALADISEAVALAPKDADMWKERAYINRELGNWQEALGDYRMALGIHQGDAMALAGMGAAELELGNSKKALTDLDEAVKTSPNNVGILCERATLYRKMHNLDEMRKDFKAARSFLPHDAELQQKSGYAEFILKQYPQAIDHFQTAMDLSRWTYRGAPYTVILSVLGSRLSDDQDSAKEWLEEGIVRFELPLATTDGAEDATVAKRWPLPVVQYLHGDISEKELLAAAGTDQDKLTEAHCYIGLQSQVDGHQDLSTQYLQLVVDNGNKNFVEYDIAKEILASRT